MRFLMSLVLATILMSFCISAFAENQSEVPSLNEVTVYATRSPQSTFQVPAIVSKVDTTAPGNATAGDVSDLLEFIPGVEVNNGPRRNGQTISIRGFDDEAVITLIDGRRQNFESAHDGRFFVDPALLKSIEIVKGASSAIYGGGAIGGVVAFETKDASDFLAPGDNVGATTSYAYRTGNNEYTPSLIAYGRTGSWDLLGSLTYRNGDDIEDGDGGKLDTEDELFSGLFKAGYTYNDFHNFNIQLQASNNDGQEPNNGAGIISSSNPIVEKEVKDNQYSFKYAFENPVNTIFQPKLHVYYNDTEVEEEDITGTNIGRIQKRELNTLGFTLDNQTKLSSNASISHTLSYGIEVYEDEQKGNNNFAAIRGGVPNADATNYGIYFQDEIAWNTSVGDFLIIPAIRYDNYESDDENNNSQDEGEVSPKLSLSYQPNNNIVLFGSWAQAFRAPNLTELYAAGLHFPGVPFAFPDNNFIPNPDLKPETVTTIEFGLGFDFGNILTQGDRGSIKGSWYSSDGDDFITQEVNIFAGTTQNVNIRNAELSGWELESQYQLNNFNAKLGMSYVKAENEDTGEYLPNNVPFTIVADLSYQLVEMNSVMGWKTRFAQDNDHVGDNETTTDGYTVHDIYYRWSSDAENLQELTLDLGIENLFDESYTRRFETLLEEGRSFTANLAYQW